MQVTACEGPLEWLGGILIAALECDQAAFEGREIGEVARREELALNDGEVDLDLVEPAGMDRCVDQNDVWPFGSQSGSGSPAAMGRTVVGDEEHTSSGAVRLLAHDLSDKALERSDAVLAFAAAEQLGAMHVPGGKVGQRAGTHVFVLDIDRATQSGRQRAVFASPSLNAGLLISAQNVIARPQCGTFPTALVQLEDAASLAGELRIAREYPGAVMLRPQRVLAEPAPERGATDLRDDPARHRLVAQFGRPARQRQASATRQLTGQRLDRHRDTGGKSGPVARGAAVRRDREAAAYRNADATC